MNEQYSGMPEDAGDTMYYQSVVAKEFLKAPESWREILTMGRMSKEEAQAFIQHFHLSLKYRAPQGMQETRDMATATIGELGEARSEAKEVSANQVSTRGYDRMDAKEGRGLRKLFTKKPKQEEPTE